MPAVQVLSVQGVPVVQHGLPEKPHSVQVGVEPAVVTHTVVVSVHVLPGQQSSPSLPHDSHVPPVVHTSSKPTSPQAEPTPTHVAGVDWSSQQPPVHCSPRQQACPVPPHGVHDVPEQTDDPPEHSSPSKTHACVVGSQQPPLHGVPVVQHASPL
jgi:hypothetical protein